jgi:hypothetical protein
MANQLPAALLASRRAQNATAFARAANAGQRVQSTRPYFSIVRATAARSGSSPAFTFTLSQGIFARAFAYQIGQDMAVAGRSGTVATKADTNLYVANQTIDSEKVYIEGIKIQLCSGGFQSDPAFFVQAMRDISVSIQFNGSQRTYDLGNGEMVPGGSAAYAGAVTSSTSTGGTVGSMTAGIPTFLNYYRIPEYITWWPAGNADSSLNVVLTAERSSAWTVSNANAPATVVMDLRVELVSSQDANRSVNQ